jgi:hypothetical protein
MADGEYFNGVVKIPVAQYHSYIKSAMRPSVPHVCSSIFGLELHCPSPAPTPQRFIFPKSEKFQGKNVNVILVLKQNAMMIYGQQRQGSMHS